MYSLGTSRRMGMLGMGGGGVDTLAPTVTITSTEASPTTAAPIPITITFSESVTGFVVGDITVGNGSAGNFAGSGTTYTADITPTALGTVTVDVGAAVCVDGAGNGNTAAAQFSIVYNTLTMSIGGAWHLDEASDGSGAVTRADATGNGNTLSDVNTTPSATGLLSNGIDCELDTKEYLDRASTASLLVGDIDFTFAAWVKLESIGITQYLGGKGTSPAGASTFAWLVYVKSSNNRIVLNVSNGTSNSSDLSPSQALSAGVWAFVIVWHDSVNNQVGAQINNNAAVTAAWTTGVLDSASFPFKVGCPPSSLGNAVATNTLDGMLDEVGFWKKVLSAAEKTALYNGGLGRAYPFYSDVPLTVAITSSESMPSAAYPIPITITFSRAVTGFAIGDISVTGCILSNFSGSGANYTVYAAPTAASGTINISAGVCVGASDGEPNLVAPQFSISSSLSLTYANAVLALDPIAYHPMQEASGTTVYDVTGNNRNGTSSSVTLAQPGEKGFSYLFGGVGGSKIVASAALTAAIDQKEYSVAFWAKVNVNAGLQVRLYNQWCNNTTEYSALEVRTGDQLKGFLKEDEEEQNDLFDTVIDETWHHIVFFNSESDDVYGVYFDGLYIPAARTVPGSTAPITSGYPEIGSFLDGWMQHVAWFDHKLSQVEVDTIST